MGEWKQIHGIIGKGVVENAGHFRTGNEGVKDEDGNVVFIAPPPIMVDGLMSDLLLWIKKNKEIVNYLVLSSIFHYEFVFIHPFSDGNGRMARFWQTAILGKWNKLFYYLPIENHIKDHQDEYYKAISQSHVEGKSNSELYFLPNIYTWSSISKFSLAHSAIIWHLSGCNDGISFGLYAK